MKNPVFDLAVAGEMVAFPGDRYCRHRRELAAAIHDSVLDQLETASARVERRLIILGIGEEEARREAVSFYRAAMNELKAKLAGFAVGDTAGGAA